MQFEYLVNDAIKFIKDNFPNRTKFYNKCQRDLSYILEALEKDIKNNTNIFTIRVGNQFWYDDQRQISSYETELEVYQFILSRLTDLNKKDFEIASNSINKLISIIKEGPDLSDPQSLKLQQSLTAQHCQRNWNYDIKIPEEDVDFLTKIATNMPTKQNKEYYDLIISTNLGFNRRIFGIAEDPFNTNSQKRNSQVYAPLLFLYVNNKDSDIKRFNNRIESYIKHQKTSVGISSGALALSAAQMNYRTGFCQCFNNKKLKKILKKYGIVAPLSTVLAVGIGHPADHAYNYNEFREEHIPPYNKSIKVFKL